MIWLSVAVIIFNTVSAMMLAWLVLHTRVLLGLGVFVRFFAAMLSVGLLLQAAGNAEILVDYRPPRTTAWIPMWFSMNALIAAAFLKTWKDLR